MRQADASRVDAAALEAALRAAVAGDVRFDRVSRALYSTDASVYQIQPLGVVVARSREDVVRVVEICRDCDCPLTLRGGGTSQTGQSLGPGIVLDTSKHLNRLLEVNVEERWARVEPGIVLDHLNAALKPHGLRFAPDISTASRATVGGMMANNSAGARSVLYGITLHHVLEQHVVLADGTQAHFRDRLPSELDQAASGETIEAAGYRVVRRLAAEHREEIARRYPRLLRRVGGYNLNEFVDPDRPFNLSRLMVGSEGTLGIVLEAKVKLVPLPKAKAVMVVEFATLLEALEATPAILAHGPSAVEVMDKFILDYTRQNAALERSRRTFVEGDPGALLCVEFYGDHADELPPRLQALERDLAARGFGYRYFHAYDLAVQARVWGLREAALGLSMAMKDDNKSLSFVEDTAVAPDRLRDFIERFLAIVRDHGTVAGVYAHASVGCLHVRPVVNLKTEAGVRQLEAIAAEVADLVLRYGAGYQSPNPTTWFDYSAWGGMSGAVEMCSGVGACRKTLEGTMCPSYMATREEAHSTRGRANVLRLAMAGRLGEAGLGDDGVREVLDLCLECRACKAECPVGVDVARFKSEFLADYWRRHGTPLRARLLGHIRELSDWAQLARPLANWSLGNAWVRRMNERFAGIDSRRPLPKWAKRTLTAQWRVRPEARDSSVLLFGDTFTNYYNPEVGLAAADVLAAAGLPATLAPSVCCGRPLISQGLLDAARQRAQEATTRLHPAIAAGKRLVFVEPSCLSAFREDIPALLRGDAQRKAKEVGAASFLFEEFLERAIADGSATLPLRPGPSQVLLHGHCHQKSLGALPPAKALLERIPNATVVDLDAGCCGMAGSFGYATEHFDVSKQIGERKLLPAARGLKDGEVLVAAGVSCRHQVHDFADVEALHPAQLLRTLLAE